MAKKEHEKSGKHESMHKKGGILARDSKLHGGKSKGAKGGGFMVSPTKSLGR